MKTRRIACGHQAGAFRRRGPSRPWVWVGLFAHSFTVVNVLWGLLGATGCARRLPAGDGEGTRSAAVVAVTRAEEPPLVLDGGTRIASPAAPAAERRELNWAFPDGPFGPTEVVISIPAGAGPARRFPVLVALHGRGESVKGSRRGARGWLDDYQLARAMSRMEEPPLRRRDFEGFVTAERLREVNAALLERPYAGLIIVCPFLADVLKGSSAFAEAEPLARFIVDVLLPQVYAETPALGTPASTGIDGVSLGGRASLLVGLARPAAFASVAALQAALDDRELERFSEMAARAMLENPRLVLRLLTSDADYFLKVNQRLSTALTARAVPHQLTRVVGTHSYRFNRGPGAVEMLLFHDRVLRGWPAP